MAKEHGMKAATAALFREIFASLAPPPELTLSSWADAYRRLSTEDSSLPGRWHTDQTPYLREIMDAVSDLGTPKVVAMMAAQLGKTTGLILNTIGYYMQYDPAPIMVIQPTITMGESFSKERLSPMLRDCPSLASMTAGPDDGDDGQKKRKKSRDTILQKSFPGGQIAIVGANSPASLASRPIRILLADEIDRYPITAGDEGDPLALAEKRQATFWNRKTVCISTPTIKELSRIAVEYENSTREEWEVPCPVCGAYQPLRWAGVVFDKGDLSEIRHVCTSCKTASLEAAWKESAVLGRYRAENPGASVRGFHVNALASTLPGATWRKVVEEFLTANEESKRGNPELLKVWTNTVLGETWEETGVSLEWEELYNRREDYGCEVPDGVILLTAGVDTQDDRFEIEVVGWGEQMESWGVAYEILYGEMNKEDVWRRLDTVLYSTFQRRDGTALAISAVCIDSGGHYTNEVYRFTKEREGRHIFPIKGQGGDEAPYLKRATKNNRESAHLFTMGVDTGKSRLFNRLTVREPGPNYCHFPMALEAGYSEEYFKGLTAEKRQIRYVKGRARFEWVLKSGARNEPLDCRNYATAAMEIYGVKNLTKNPVKRTKKSRRELSGGV